jgi:hypothetical protein
MALKKGTKSKSANNASKSSNKKVLKP